MSDDFEDMLEVVDEADAAAQQAQLQQQKPRKTRQAGTPLDRGNACQACKARKVKCGGEKPNCRRCDSVGRECVYVPFKSWKGDMQRMKRRINELESALKTKSDSGGSQPGNAGDQSVSPPYGAGAGGGGEDPMNGYGDAGSYSGGSRAPGGGSGAAAGYVQPPMISANAALPSSTTRYISSLLEPTSQNRPSTTSHPQYSASPSQRLPSLTPQSHSHPNGHHSHHPSLTHSISNPLPHAMHPPTPVPFPTPTSSNLPPPPLPHSNGGEAAMGSFQPRPRTKGSLSYGDAQWSDLMRDMDAVGQGQEWGNPEMWLPETLVAASASANSAAGMNGNGVAAAARGPTATYVSDEPEEMPTHSRSAPLPSPSHLVGGTPPDGRGQAQPGQASPVVDFVQWLNGGVAPGQAGNASSGSNGSAVRIPGAGMNGVSPGMHVETDWSSSLGRSTGSGTSPERLAQQMSSGATTAAGGSGARGSTSPQPEVIERPARMIQPFGETRLVKQARFAHDAVPHRAASWAVDVDTPFMAGKAAQRQDGDAPVPPLKILPPGERQYKQAKKVAGMAVPAFALSRVKQPDDLPPTVRDHLLKLYFAKERLYGMEMHQGRFWSRLAGPIDMQPHRCLLNAMYLMACKQSPFPAVRELEHHFAANISDQLDEAIGDPDTMLDAIRACTMLAVYLYSEGHVALAYVKVGTANQIAKSCGLHQIKSNVFEPPQAPSEGRLRFYHLPPPSDSIDLGERVWAFWDLHALNSSGDFGLDWATCWTKDNITTPFPLPLLEYELQSAGYQDDNFLGDLFDSNKVPRPAVIDDPAVSRTKALVILQEAFQMYWLEPENPEMKDMPEHLRLPARIRNPRACFKIEQAIHRFETSLKGVVREFEKPLQAGITSMQPHEAFLCLAIGLAKIECCNVHDDGLPNTESLRIARRLIEIVQLLGNQHYGDCLTPFFVVMFIRLSRIFAKEMKRLASLGSMAEVMFVKSEMTFLMQAVQDLGQKQRIELATNEAAVLAGRLQDLDINPTAEMFQTGHMPQSYQMDFHQ